MENTMIGWEVIISVLVTLVLAFQTAIWRRLDKMDRKIEEKLDRVECEKQIVNCEKIWCARVSKDLDALHQRLREMREESIGCRNEIKDYVKTMHEGIVDNLEQLWAAHRNHSHGNLVKNRNTISLIEGESN